MQIEPITITAKTEIQPPNFTAEMAVATFESLSESRNNRPDFFGDVNAEEGAIFQAEDELYLMLLKRLKYEVVTVKVEMHHGTP